MTCHPVYQRVIQIAAGIGGDGQLGDGRTDEHNEDIPIPIDTANMEGKR